jgi:hypothetical protein
MNNKFINNTLVDGLKMVRLFSTTNESFVGNTLELSELLAGAISSLGGSLETLHAFEVWGDDGFDIRDNVIEGFPYAISIGFGFDQTTACNYTIADNIIDSKNYWQAGSLIAVSVGYLYSNEWVLIYGNEYSNYDKDLNFNSPYIGFSTNEDYRNYEDGDVPTTNHVIMGNSSNATYEVKKLESGSKVGYFNDSDDNTALQVGIDVTRAIQGGDAITWTLNIQDIVSGKSAVWGIFNETFGAFLFMSAFKSNDNVTREFYVWDDDGLTMIQDFSFDTWYSFTVVFYGSGAYTLLINGVSVVNGRSMFDAGNTVGYLGFLDTDGPTNWQGYVDDVMTSWI